MSITEAITEDLFEICELLFVGAAEFPDYSNIEINTGKGALIIKTMITDPSAIVLVSKTNDVVTGVMFGVIQSFWFSNETYALDQMLYVHPEYRTGFAGIKLIKMFIALARCKGAAKVFCGITTGINIEQTSKLHQRLGFEEIGKTYSLDLRSK